MANVLRLNHTVDSHLNKHVIRQCCFLRPFVIESHHNELSLIKTLTTPSYAMSNSILPFRQAIISFTF